MITWGNTAWPWWLGASIGSFLAMEVWALIHRTTDNTLSNWVWHVLNATTREPMSQWNAAHFLFFGAWVVMVVWLTWHFFFHWFALWAPCHGSKPPRPASAKTPAASVPLLRSCVGARPGHAASSSA